MGVKMGAGFNFKRKQREMRAVLDVKYRDDTDEHFIEIPHDMLDHVGWKEGDTLSWEDNKDGSWTLSKKKETKYVLVECIQQYRMRYVVELNETDPTVYALDTVALNEAKEFSQLSLDETIFSHRVITKEDAIKLCDEDNDYTKDWDDEKKIETFVTKIGQKNAEL